jgi:dipeptidyl aminopeptidase/acylaminoacyl peptidase
MKLLLMFCLLAATSPGQSQPDIHLFDYDSKAPLYYRENDVQDINGIKVRDISYASPKGGSVPADLIVPPGEGPFPAVIFVHWGQGNRTGLAGCNFKRSATAIDPQRYMFSPFVCG